MRTPFLLTVLVLLLRRIKAMASSSMRSMGPSKCWLSRNRSPPEPAPALAPGTTSVFARTPLPIDNLRHLYHADPLKNGKL